MLIAIFEQRIEFFCHGFVALSPPNSKKKEPVVRHTSNTSCEYAASPLDRLESGGNGGKASINLFETMTTNILERVLGD